MTPEDQIKAIAELEKWYVVQNDDGLWSLHNKEKCVGCYGWETEDGAWGALSRYGYDEMTTSRDAIVPVIEKHPLEVKRKVVHIVSDLFYSSKDEKNQWYNGGWRVDCKAMACLFSTPPQLCEALLRATGKWIE